VHSSQKQLTVNHYAGEVEKKGGKRKERPTPRIHLFIFLLLLLLLLAANALALLYNHVIQVGCQTVMNTTLKAYF
jgi:hypothetical protein